MSVARKWIPGIGYCQFNCIDVLIRNLSFPSPSVRPVKHWTTVTDIHIEMKLYTVIDLDTSLQSLTSVVWFTMAWKNEFIQWKPEQFCSIDKLILSNAGYWQPDLYIYERIETMDKSPPVPFYLIENNGYTKRVMPIRIVSFCKLNIFKFPFDTQRCNITFGTYVHPAHNVRMLSMLNSFEVLNNTLDVYVGQGDWYLLDITVANDTVLSYGQAFSTVYYEITLQRAPVAYVMTLIAPACLMVLMDIISMFIVMESGGRLGFKITIVLGFSVLLSILNTMLPSSDVPPLLGIFCCVCMAAMTISIIECITISSMLMLSEAEPTVPSWIKSWILRHLARVLCFKEEFFIKYGIIFSETEKYENKKVLEEQSLETKRKPQRDKEDNLDVILLKMLLLEVLKIHKKIVDSRKMENIKTEWHAAALVLERFVLIIYLLTVVILLAVVLIIWLT
ncbi:5-hydroxytryptamine receptor 3A-like [Dendropsophus ebraccatus]|uniref:5-hydroxytryptamine receptor 3A-like n=1 Tax=Dendropsophus ebraccatus TaxID=150705 RepID=UPI003831926A